jgi:hypothetical protein
MEDNRKLPHTFLLAFFAPYCKSPPPLHREKKYSERGRGRATVAVLALTRFGEVGSNEDDTRKSRVSRKKILFTP